MVCPTLIYSIASRDSSASTGKAARRVVARFHIRVRCVYLNASCLAPDRRLRRLCSALTARFQIAAPAVQWPKWAGCQASKTSCKCPTCQLPAALRSQRGRRRGAGWGNGAMRQRSLAPPLMDTRCVCLPMRERAERFLDDSAVAVRQSGSAGSRGRAGARACWCVSVPEHPPEVTVEVCA